jgi:peptidoglycan-associated lipoprotein
MKKTNFLLAAFVSLIACLLFVGCKKNSTMPVETVETPPPPPPVMTWENVDTNSFAEADLDAELARKINENLQVLYFEYNKYDLTEESLQKVRTASDFLKSQPQIRIRLDGHADERGTTEYNMALGENRAKAVYEVLSRFGIDARRIETVSFGREKPANPDCGGVDSCHALNRRVEYTVIGK